MIYSRENNLSEHQHGAKPQQKFRWTKKQSWIFVSVLLIVAIGMSVYSFFFKNAFSKDKILIQISGPEEAISGKEINWLVSIKNQSEITVKDITLNFEYPSGVFDSNGSVKKREQKVIKSLAGGEQKSESFSGNIFGVKDEIKNAKVSVTFHPEGISTLFENQASFSTRISDTSVLFSMEMPTKVDPGDELSISLSWQSSFPFPLSDLELRFSPPEGFERISPKTDNERIEDGKSIFDIGALNEGEGGKLEIKGKIKGNVNEEKLFKADFGIFDARLYEFIPLATVEKVVKIRTSTLDVFLKVNGEAEYVASPGENLAFIVNFINSGEDVYRNLNLVVNLESDILDFSTLKAPGGKVEGKKITFSSDNFPDLLFLGPYGQGSVGFNVRVKDYDSNFSKENGFIKTNISFGTIEKSFQTKVSSKISFTEDVYSISLEGVPQEAKNVFNFQNNNTNTQGNAEEGNSFVIGFHVKNQGNKLKDVKITMFLADGISFENKVFPENTGVNFDQEKQELVLSIGDIPTNFSKDYFLEFKIAPQITIQEIHSEVKLNGKDAWTTKNFEITLPAKSADVLK